jgi:hypothetical protein
VIGFGSLSKRANGKLYPNSLIALISLFIFSTNFSSKAGDGCFPGAAKA